jgi:hypothetical protein
MYLARVEVPRHAMPAAAPALVLAITVWSLAHPVALIGHIDLGEAGAPMWIGTFFKVSRTASRGTH